MNNQELIDRFETNAISEDSFHHADHVRLAFAYLSEYPVLVALGKFIDALKRFATAHGKTQLYNGNYYLRVLLFDSRADGSTRGYKLGGIRPP